jgi:glycosyltransferase involved in cell wall biosynthesis
LFEDDVVLANDLDARMEELDLPDDWEVFFLGCKHLERPIPFSPGIVRVTRAADHHAVAFRSSSFKKVMRALSGFGKKTIPSISYSDLKMSDILRDMAAYAAFPNLAWQAATDSDNNYGVNASYDIRGAQLCNLHAVSGMKEEMSVAHGGDGRVGINHCLPTTDRNRATNISNQNPPDLPLVSAVVVTLEARYDLLREAIEDFLQQTYVPKQLLIVVDERTYGERLIRDFPFAKIVIAEPGLTLGELRNIGLDHADGEFLIQWDDDDRYRSDRMYMQAIELVEDASLAAVYLQRQVIDFGAYSVERFQPKGIMGTVIHRRRISARYPPWSKGEDAEFKKLLDAQSAISIDNHSEMYIRRVHESNTWDMAHFRKILALESKYGNDSYYGMIRRIANGLPRTSRFEQIFPKIYYLNAATDEAERFEMEYQLANSGIVAERLGIPLVSHRHKAMSHDRGKRHATILASRIALRLAAKVNAPAVVIVADDLRIQDGMVEVVERAQIPSDWDVVVFGGIYKSTPVIAGSLCVRVEEMSEMWMYAVRRRAMRTVRIAMRRQTRDGKSLAEIISKMGNGVNVYAIHPDVVSPRRFAFQGSIPAGSLWHNKSPIVLEYRYMSAIEAQMLDTVRNGLLSNRAISSYSPVSQDGCEESDLVISGEDECSEVPESIKLSSSTRRSWIYPTGICNGGLLKIEGGYLCVATNKTWTFREELGLVAMPQRPIQSALVWVDLDDSLRTQSSGLLRVFESDGTVVDPRFRSYEDPRLFFWKGEIHLLAVERTSDSKARSLYDVRLLKLEGREGHLLPMWHPFPLPQKNWLPIVMGDRLYFDYQLEPRVIAEYVNGQVKLVYPSNSLLPVLSGPRGGSPPINLEDGGLLACYHLCPNYNLGTRLRRYQTVFVKMSASLPFNVLAVSKPLKFEYGRRIEFVTGLAWGCGQELIVSYGIEDAEACLRRLSLETVNSLLVPVRR